MIREILGLGEPPWLIGHRGVRGETIENSVPGFLLAVDQGADFIELDVRLTADGILVAFHDEDLERLTGAPGNVEETRLSELPRLLPGDERIPTLGEVLWALPEDFPLNVEIKIDRADPRSVVEAVVEQAGPRPRTVFSSFDHDILGRLRAALPDAALAPLDCADVADLVDAARRLDACAVHAAERNAGPQLVSRAGDLELPVLIYTVNEAAVAARLRAMGVSGVFTDFPGRLRAELGW